MRKLMVVPLLLFAVACQPGAAPLTDEDVAATRDLGQAYAQAVLAGDADAVAAVYSDDAMELPPHRPAVTGKETIRDQYAAAFSAGMSAEAFTLTSEEIDGIGDLAYERGTWTWTGAGPEMTEPATETGKYISIARRQADGSWLWTDVIWNSDTPLPEMEAGSDEPALE